MPNLNVGLGLAMVISSSAQAYTPINTYICGVWDVLINMEQEGLLGQGTCDDIVYGCLDWGNDIVSCEDIAYNHCTELIGYDTTAASAAKNIFDIGYEQQQVCDQGCNAGEYITEEAYCMPCDSGQHSTGYETECHDCPSHTSGVVYSVGNNGNERDCYVPSSASWSFSDSAGSGTARFTSDCYYY